MLGSLGARQDSAPALSALDRVGALPVRLPRAEREGWLGSAFYLEVTFQIKSNDKFTINKK
jgi:hypothetical protein